jgi:prepilin-type N-terminal cleavage/methylation domain-containing protein/prepilin-type processing-associated H-X9-DG protein
MKTRTINTHRAFTLIELLVVIAIIAILAAILFPVFAQAKAAAKAAVGVSNMKQIALAHLMYSNDYDDNKAPRAIQDLYNCNAQGTGCSVSDEHEWKELLAPYVKNQGLYQDALNSMRQTPDLHSDPAARASYNWTPTILPTNLVFSVSYNEVNWQLPGQPGNFVNQSGFVLTSLPSPSTAGIAMETHSWNDDDGPYEGWAQYTASSGYANGLPTPAAYIGKWNIMGDAYGDKAMNAAYADGHAKRISYSARDCTALHEGATGTTTDFWDITGEDLGGPNGNYSWEATNCVQLPAAFQ